MKIGIIAAIENEFKLLKNYLENLKVYQVSGIKFITGILENQEIIIVQSGIGKVLASLGTTLLIQNYQINLLINIGSCGSISSNLKLGKVIIADSLAYHDIDITAFGYNYGQSSHHLPLYYKSDKNLLLKMKETAQKINYQKEVGLIVTGDIFINSKKKIRKILKHFPSAIGCEMEGAAIAQIAHQFNIPFIAVKVVSDAANIKAVKHFNYQISDVKEKLTNLVINFINNI